MNSQFILWFLNTSYLYLYDRGFVNFRSFILKKKNPLFHIQNSFDKVQESGWKCGCFF